MYIALKITRLLVMLRGEILGVFKGGMFSSDVDICHIVNVPVKQVNTWVHFIWLYICMIEKSKQCVTWLRSEELKSVCGDGPSE